MRVPRWAAMFAALMALMLLVAACGDDVPEEPEDTGEIEEEPEEPEEPQAEEPEDTGDTEETDETAEEPEDVEADVAAAEGLCEGDAADVEAPDDYTVGLVTDIGSVDDGTFNQYAYEGLLAAADCFGIDDGNVNVIETTSEADYQRNLDTILESDPDAVITVGFLIQDATEAVAAENPDVHFIGVDQFVEESDNHVGLQFREDQAAFMVGAMAGLLTETDTVAVVGGREDVPPVVRLVNGYEAGANYTNEDVNVLSVYLPSFDDPAAGRSAAEQFLGEGADVVFGAGGPTGSGGIQAAAEAGAWAMGVDQDEYFTTFGEGDTEGADRLATSAVKRVDVGVFEQIRASIETDFEGGVFTLEAANDGVTYAPPHDADVPQDVLDEVEEIRQGLADGSIETGIDPVTGEPEE